MTISAKKGTVNQQETNYYLNHRPRKVKTETVMVLQSKHTFVITKIFITFSNHRNQREEIFLYDKKCAAFEIPLDLFLKYRVDLFF